MESQSAVFPQTKDGVKTSAQPHQNKDEILVRRLLKSPGYGPATKNRKLELGREIATAALSEVRDEHAVVRRICSASYVALGSRISVGAFSPQRVAPTSHMAGSVGVEPALLPDQF